MSPRLNRAEFWLLTTAVELGIPLRMLSLYDGDEPRHNHIEAALNKRGHGQTARQLARALERMNTRGWIYFHTLLKPEPQSVLHDVESAICERGTFADGWYYSLTAQGGRVWETFARPDWDRFIEDDDEGDPDRTYDRTVRVTNERRLLRYLAAVEQETHIEPDSRQIHTIEPWQVTYWKVLPAALQCTFRCRRKAEWLSCSPASWLRGRWCDWL
jgi:hypothetical protein